MIIIIIVIIISNDNNNNNNNGNDNDNNNNASSEVIATSARMRAKRARFCLVYLGSPRRRREKNLLLKLLHMHFPEYRCVPKIGFP